MRWSHRPLAIAALAAACALPGVARAAEGASFALVGTKFPENLASGVGGEETFGWLPYYVELRALTDRAVRVELNLRVAWKGNKTAAVVRKEVEVAPGAPTRAWVYVPYPGGNEPENFAVEGTARAAGGESVALHAKQFYRGRAAGDQEIEVPMFVVGEHTQAGASLWGGVDGFQTDAGQTLTDRRILAMKEEQLPDQALGYDAVRFLILRNPDVKALEPAQVDAIRRWVYLGGRVIFVPSPRGEIFRSSLLREFLPGAKVGDPQTAAGFVPENLFVVDKAEKARLVAKAGDDWGDVRFVVADPIEAKAERQIVSAGPAGERRTRLYLEVPFGAGTVGVLTIDDMAPEAKGLSFRRQLWELIAIEGRGRRGMDLRSARAEAQAGERKASGAAIIAAVRGGLPRDLSTWFIVLIVIAYLVIIGPGVYFVLKRLRRLPAIVWVEPLVVVVYLGIIAVTAYAAKGVLTRVRTVTVIDHRWGDPFALRRSWLGMFSATEAEYRIAAPESECIHPIGETTAEGEDPAAIRIDAEGGQRGAALIGYRIAQWGTKTVAAWSMRDVGRAYGVSMALRGDPVPAGTKDAGWSVTLANHTGFPIRRGFLLLGVRDAKGAYLIGPIADGAEATFTSPPAVNIDAPAPKEGDDGFERSDLLRGAVRAMAGGAGDDADSLTFIGVLDRDQRDFDVDRPTTLQDRVDLFVERR